MPTLFDLGKRLKAKYPGIYDDLSDDEVGRRIRAKYPEAYGDFMDPPPGPPTAQNNPAFANLGNLDLKPLDVLPTVGGIAGGIGGAALGSVVPGVGTAAGGIAGSALLGGGGEALKEYLGGQRLSPNKIAAQGAGQGVAELTGLGAAKLVGKTATALWKGSMAKTAAAKTASMASPETQLILKALKANMPLRAQVLKHVLEDPRVMRKLAMTLHEPLSKGIARHSPKVLANLLVSQLTSSELPDATQP